MAAGRLIIEGYMPALDASARPLSGAKIYFYLNGTTTLTTVYADEDLTTPLTNPVVANSAGQFASIFADAALLFSVKVTNSAGGQLTSRDGVRAIGPGGSGGTMELATVAAAEAVELDDQTFVNTAGYAAAGDGGGALYIKVDEEPAHDAKFQSADGAWWEYRPGPDGINVLVFGLIGEGVDTETIQAAVDYAASIGLTTQRAQTVVLPVRNYELTGQVTIQSHYPVNLVSEMHGWNQTDPENAAHIVPAEAFDGYLFSYESPTENKSEGGGGLVRGLSFFDPSRPNPSAQGERTIRGALNLDSFNLSRVEDCHFHNLKGRAIHTGMAVMSSVSGCVIRYCGDTDASAVDLDPPGGAYATQSFSLLDCRVEVCHDAPYVNVRNSSCQVIKIIGCGFEADPDNAPTSAQNFIRHNGRGLSVSACHLDRDGDATQLKIEAGGWFARIEGTQFSSNGGSSPSLDIAGLDNSASGCTFLSGKTGVEIAVSGLRNTLTGNNLVSAGSVDLSGELNLFDGNTLASLYTAEDYWIEVGTTCAASNNILSGSPAVDTPSLGGIRLTGTAPSATGNLIKGFANIGLRVNTENGMAMNNRIFSTGDDAISVATGVLATRVRDNWTDDGSDYLSGSLVYDPGSMAPGAKVGPIAVTVAGARQGDYCNVSFDNYNTANIVITAAATGVDTVIVWLENKSSTETDNLGEGTISVQVIKR